MPGEVFRFTHNGVVGVQTLSIVLPEHKPAPFALSDMDLRQSPLRPVPTVDREQGPALERESASTPVARVSAAIAVSRLSRNLWIPRGKGKIDWSGKDCSTIIEAMQTPSSINSAGMPSRLCAMTQRWTAFDCVDVGFRS